MSLHRSLLLALVAAWLLLGAAWVWAAGLPPVSRTQEARVLETAREMIGRPARDWLVPRLNGAVRLRKPPLAYWMAAGSMEIFGVGERAGRLPTVVLTWINLGLTFAIARRLFSVRVALLAAAALAGMWAVARYGLLAETDAPATAFLTAGVYAALRAADAARDGRRDGPWLHALAAAAAGVVLAKGPPAAFLFLFVVGLCTLRRDARPLRRFFTRGAVVTLLVLAVPWFVYVRGESTEQSQLREDFLNSAEGGDHHGPPWAYGPMLLQATLPWTPLWGVALMMTAGPLWRGRAVWRGGGSRRDEGLWTLALWGGAILLPLAAWGNKQPHYLLPLMPPTAVLIGWAATRGPRPAAAAVATAVVAVGLAVTGPAVLATASRYRPGVSLADAALAAALVGLSVAALFAWRRTGVRGAIWPVAVQAALAMGAVYAWLPPLTGGLSRRAADAVEAAYPDARFVFRTTELPVMSWTMRRAIPPMTDAELTSAAADPKTVVLDQQRDDEKPPAPPTGYVAVRTIDQKGNVLHVYRPAGLSR